MIGTALGWDWFGTKPAADDEVFSITALWDRSRTESGEDVLSCAIITMPENELLAEIHNAKQRMPLIGRELRTQLVLISSVPCD